MFIGTKTYLVLLQIPRKQRLCIMLVSMCSNLQISRLNCEVEGSLGARVKSHHNLVVEYWVFAAAFSHTVANRSHITQTTSCLPPGSCLYICPPASCLYICPPPSCLLYSRTTCSVLLIHCQAGSAPGHFSDLLFNGKIVLFLFVIQYCPSPLPLLPLSQGKFS